MADPMMVLGISKGPTTIRDLARLQKRSKQLCKYYLKAERKQDAKKVEWAYQQLKKAVKLPERPTADAPPDAAGGKGSRKRHGGSPGAPGPPPKRAAGVDRRTERREAIREKLAARRAEKESAAEDKEKRQEAIKERLAAKRLFKQVRVEDESACKKAVIDFLAAPRGDDDTDVARVVLICPVSIERIKTPARGRACKHLQCFDLEAYLVNKCRCCPVCDIELSTLADLFVDSHFRRMMDSAGEEANEVCFGADGGWQVATAEAESEWSGMSVAAEDDEDDEEEDDDDAGDAMMAGGSPHDAPTEAKAAADEAAAAARLAKAAAFARIQEEVAAAKADARRAAEERKLKALLPFIPKGRAQAALAAAKAAAKAAAVAAAVADAPTANPSDEHSYVVVELSKPMGIVLEANPPPTGGVVVASLDEGGAAASHGRVRRGDQLVGVGGTCVMGRDVDACFDAIQAYPDELTKLTLFRGKPSDLYGNESVSRDWIACLLDRVRDGSLRPSPPLEKRAKGRQPRLAAADEEDAASSSSFAGGSASGSDDRGLPPLPAALADLLSGAGLEQDLDAVVEGLPTLAPEAVPMRRLSASDPLLSAVLAACAERNAEAWRELRAEARATWRKSARRRLSQAAATQALLAEQKQRKRQEEKRRAEVAERERRGEEDGALLSVEPRPVRFSPQGTAKLFLKNRSGGYVAYRIRTNAPALLSVKPCGGTLAQGEVVVAKITSSDKRIGRRGVRFAVNGVAVPSSAALTRERWAELSAPEMSEWVVQGSE